MIKLGTSGYSFQDWIGPFYPPGIDKGKMLDFYKEHFQVVEINSTYYRIPHPAVFAKLNDKTPPHFEFMVKVYKDITHRPSAGVESMPELLKSLETLIKVNKFKGFLAQFPFSFKATNDNYLHILKVKEACQNFPLFVEFRNSDWINDKLHDRLREHHVGYVNVDEPPLKGLIPPQDLVTNGIGYVRFHGRNAQNWWHPGEGDRYDYEYSEDELRQWLPLVEKIFAAASDTYLFFNNCHMGFAVKNAKMMRELIKNQIGLEVE